MRFYDKEQILQIIETASNMRDAGNYENAYKFLLDSNERMKRLALNNAIETDELLTEKEAGDLLISVFKSIGEKAVEFAEQDVYGIAWQSKVKEARTKFEDLVVDLSEYSHIVPTSKVNEVIDRIYYLGEYEK